MIHGLVEVVGRLGDADVAGLARVPA